MDTAARIHDELRALRQRLPEVSGVVLASIDGMPVASDTAAVDPDPVAAMAATSLGFGQQFARMAGYGPVQEWVIEASGGTVVTYPAGGLALLTVLAHHGVEPAALHAEGRAVAHRVGALYEGLGGRGEARLVPVPSDSCAPRPTRAPSSMSPATLPARHPVPRPPARP